MSARQLKQLESLCGHPLPAPWLHVMENFPEVLRTALRSETGDISDGTVSRVELQVNLNDVLALNREVRSSTILDPDNLEFRWPDNLLVIGETDEGDYFCLDTSGDFDGVLQFRHLDVEFEELTDSLDEFVEMLIETYVADRGLDLNGESPCSHQ